LVSRSWRKVQENPLKTMCCYQFVASAVLISGTPINHDTMPKAKVSSRRIFNCY
jgi:hypothetical protein